RVSRPDHEDPLPGERGRTAVVGGVQHRARATLQPRQCRPVRMAEGAGGGDHGSCRWSTAVPQAHLEPALGPTDPGDAVTR
ncbi:hypothetical protein STRIP9103_09427, partial [Streptomyces ipomoeae 91-03]